MPTNLLIAIISFVVFILIVLSCAKLGKTFLFVLSTAFILISNVTVQMNTELFSGVTISWAIIIYSLVYLITDLVIEFYGRKTAYHLAASNLTVQIIFWIYIWLSLKVIPSETGNSAKSFSTMESLFSANTQITIAAIIAAIGPFTDIFATNKIRTYLSNHPIFGSEIANLLARAKLSTFLGEIINTSIFFSIALLNTATDSATLFSIILTATISKWIISAADIPFLWLYFRIIGAPQDANESITTIS